jgi:hypothetical protein
MKFFRSALWTTVCIALLFTSATPSFAKVKSVSTDGEATVYLTSDFSRGFDLDYRVAFMPAPKNRSWSVVSILLLSGDGHGGSVSVGLSRGFPNATTLAAFTTSAAPGKKQGFQSSPVICASSCRIELRGSVDAINAVVNGTAIESWSRQSLGIREPAVQLNAEVAGLNDIIFATVIPVQTVAAGKAIRPTCAFTTQGVEPRPSADGITFIGTRRQNARVTYISLVTGSTGDSCPKH